MIRPRGLLWIAWSLFLIARPAAGAAKWVALEPGPDANPVVVRVNGHPRDYYRLNANSPLVLTVEGPIQLRVLSRAELKRGDPPTVRYRLLITEGGATLKDRSVESSPAERARVEGSKAVICKSRTLIVPIPVGTHHVQISQHELPSVLVRVFSLKPGGAGRSMISITPVDAARSVTVSEGERLIPYFSILPGKPVHFRVVGPTTLELTTRLDFDSTMRGAQIYRLGISSGGRRIRDVTLRTTKATTATYTDLKDRVASKLDRTVIPVATGLHDIFVELLEPKKGSVEVHARIPQPSAGSEE